jgi:hypothetical protein
LHQKKVGLPPNLRMSGMLVPGAGKNQRGIIAAGRATSLKSSLEFSV